MATSPPTDDELNTWIIARLNLLGIDLSVLPVSDSSAPADQTRILSSVRSILRSSVPTIRSLLSHGSIPRRGDGSALAIPAGESRPPAVVGSSAKPHRLS